jgi:hypothetical protein
LLSGLLANRSISNRSGKWTLLQGVAWYIMAQLTKGRLGE